MDGVDDGEVPQSRLAARRQELRGLASRSKEVLLFSAAVGVVTGVAVGVFDTVIERCLDQLAGLPLAVVAFAPFVGLAIAALILRWPMKLSPATSDEYLEAFHDPGHRLGMRALVVRLVASIATLGTGGPMGLEGPSIYMGATFGETLQHRFPRVFSAQNRRLLLVAGAAAGVAAIFKAPATGAVFALEVPYQDDLARRMLAPALVASASGYLAFVALHGTTPLFDVAQTPGFSFKDLAGAAILGGLAGIGARVFAWFLRRAKRFAREVSPWIRVPLAGAALAGIFGLAHLVAGESLTTGPGYDTIRWALDPAHSTWVVAAILVLRCAATVSVVGGGGVGGLFIPLVVAGALTGRMVGGEIHALDTSLFTVIGVAAFLGAGYRVPLAAVTFVAETTGAPGFVVPGLIAAVVAELLMGRSSVTTLQRAPVNG